MFIKYGMQKCPYCGEKFKRLTSNHIKKHNITWMQYLKEYRNDEYIDKIIIDFLNDYYVTVRSKYLIYNYREKNPVICKSGVGNVPLNLGTIKQHRSHSKTLGIFFPLVGSKVIGLDLDCLDIKIVKKAYEEIIRFINNTSVLISFSGNKGYHIDIFFNEIVSRDVIKKFYNFILNKVGVSDKIIELRGASNQGYKLPFGINQGTQKYCYACDENIEEIKDRDLEKLLYSRTKSNIKSIENAIAECWDIKGQISNGPLSSNDIIEFSDIKENIQPLENYSNLNKDFIEDLLEIYKNGFNGEGLRNKYTLKIALLLKCNLLLEEKENLSQMLDWKNRCKGYRASDKEFELDIKNTVKRIYKEDMQLITAAKEIKISKVEIKEILSINTGNKLKTKALRQLYYMFLLHSKAYANVDGVFFFTLKQMQKMGATNNKTRLLEQINNLIELNKVYKYATRRISREKNAPAQYKLTNLSEITIDLTQKTFNLCNNIGQCKDCIEYATCYLIRNTTELKKYYKGKKKLCLYNKD